MMDGMWTFVKLIFSERKYQSCVFDDVAPDVTVQYLRLRVGWFCNSVALWTVVSKAVGMVVLQFNS